MEHPMITQINKTGYPKNTDEQPMHFGITEKEMYLMDRKTLEYMEERATNGRDIVNRIEELKRHISKVKRKSYQCLDIKVDSGQLRLTGWGEEKVVNNYQSETEAHMLNVFIDITNSEIQRLEELLAEL